MSAANIEMAIHARSSVTDNQTGESLWLLEWPTGTYAGGSPSYERPEAA